MQLKLDSRFPNPLSAPSAVRLRVVFDNVAHHPRLSTAWGFACVVQSGGHTVLFDTGSNGDMLLQNMRQLGIRPQRLDAVVISHLHSDHVGGLDYVLRAHPGLTVFVPASIALPLRRTVRESGARIRAISQPQRLYPTLHSTGEIPQGDTGLGEQALIVESDSGPLLITGCAHPGIDLMVEHATRQMGRPLHLVMGGFHLRQKSDEQLLATAARLKSLGVERVAPSHCSGEEATTLLREAWGEHFIASGCGAALDPHTPRVACHADPARGAGRAAENRLSP